MSNSVSTRHGQGTSLGDVNEDAQPFGQYQLIVTIARAALEHMREPLSENIYTANATTPTPDDGLEPRPPADISGDISTDVPVDTSMEIFDIVAKPSGTKQRGLGASNGIHKIGAKGAEGGAERDINGNKKGNNKRLELMLRKASTGCLVEHNTEAKEWQKLRGESPQQTTSFFNTLPTGCDTVGMPVRRSPFKATVKVQASQDQPNTKNQAPTFLPMSPVIRDTIWRTFRNPGAIMFQCYSCYGLFNKIDDCRMHMRCKCHVALQKCSSCGKSLFSVTETMQRLRTHPQGAESIELSGNARYFKHIYQCRCPVKYEDDLSLVRHYGRCHGKKAKECFKQLPNGLATLNEIVETSLEVETNLEVE